MKNKVERKLLGRFIRKANKLVKEMYSSNSYVFMIDEFVYDGTLEYCTIKYQIYRADEMFLKALHGQMSIFLDKSVDYNLGILSASIWAVEEKEVENGEA